MQIATFAHFYKIKAGILANKGAKYKEFSGLNLPEIEKEILKNWDEEQAFEKSISLRQGNKPFVFYEGPPSANGMPGIHHVISRTLKDLVCRYKTMKGYQVKRKGGWDTHGLPVELGVEKELGITKEDIGKKISVEEYNKKCREAVLRYKDKWDELTKLIGYWVDLENPYITFNNDYIETLWWLLKQLYDKDLLYEDVSIQPYSPAAGTGLSSHELNQPGTYKDVRDTSCVAMFALTLKGTTEKHFLAKKFIELSNSGASKALSPLERAGGEVFFLAWTTTPWTLPSNLGLTVGGNIDYVLVKTFNPYTHLPVNIILAKALIHKYFKAEDENIDFNNYSSSSKTLPWKILNEFKGKELEGTSYEQLLPFETNKTNNPNSFKILLGDFVTTEDGTGIVHTAPAFGADDFKIGKKYDIGILTMVDREGKFVDGLGEFSGRYVKNYKDDPNYEDVNVDICVKLKKENRAFKVEKYEHSYPHCWRTDKPILYYPLDAWFIKTTALKGRMIELNKTINWKPKSTGEGRFGNWLENMVDWNLSRSRFWGTPLPVWRTEDGAEEICIGSLEELFGEIQKASAHDSNKKTFTHFNQIEKGFSALEKLLNSKEDQWDVLSREEEDIGSISFLYGKEGDEGKDYKGGFGFSHIIAKRNAENNDGIYTAYKLIDVIVRGKIIKEVELKKTVHIKLDDYEAVLSLDLHGNKKTWVLTGYKQKKSPGASGEFSTTSGATQNKPTFSRFVLGADDLNTKLVKKEILNGLVDLHKPFVDEIILVSSSGKPMKRVPDLVDVWFDSGAMPYAQWHFPFENIETFAENYPADFIAEGVDQTRGWFYTLHAIAALVKESVQDELKKNGIEANDITVPGLAYKTCVSNGLVLDKNGVKMSKRLGNIVDPFKTIETFGADATRWYLITNASPWDNLKFDLDGIKEVQRKFFGTLYNTYQFFALYANVDGFAFTEDYIPYYKRTEIDRWVLSSLNTLIKKVTEAMDDYEPTIAGRLMEEFLDEHLSNWYVRLSRRRFWKGEYEHDKISAYQTLYECLETITRLMAPVSPFFSDAIFKNLNAITKRINAESVHHTDFPVANEDLIDKDLEERMQLAQDISSLALSLRKKASIKVRQPLQRVYVPALNFKMRGQISVVTEIIKSEINVKDLKILNPENDLIKKKAKANFKTLGKRLGDKMKWAAQKISNFDELDIRMALSEGSFINGFLLNTEELSNGEEPIYIYPSDLDITIEQIPGLEIASKGNLTVALDISLSDELKKEGDAREFVNRIQNIRKDKGFDLTDRINLNVLDNTVLKPSINTYKNYICAEILADDLNWVPEIKDGIEIEVNGNLLKVSVNKKG